MVRESMLTEWTSSPHTDHPVRKPVSFSVKWFSVAVSLVASLVLGELAVRLCGVALPGWVQPDPVVGWSYVPGARYLEKSEGYSAGTLNGHGLRDLEHAYAKPAGVFRILILGDSFSEAFQLPIEQSYPRILEQLLSALPGAPAVELIVLARSGMGTAQQRRWFQTEGRRYQPDLVLLQTCINDPADNVPTIRGRDHVPYYYWDNGKLMLDESFRQSWSYPWRLAGAQLRRRSALAEWAYGAIRRELVSSYWTPRAGEQGGSRGLPIDALENHYLPAPPEPWSEALAMTASVFQGLDEEVRSAGAQLVVFGATDGIELGDRDRELVLRHGLVLDHRENWWRLQCERRSIRFVPLLAEFLRRRHDSGRTPHGFGNTLGQGHWNELGHRWAAECLARELGALL